MMQRSCSGRSTHESAGPRPLLAAARRHLQLLCQVQLLPSEQFCTEPAHLTADQHWFERAVLNLVDNAIKFTAEGGRVRIETKQRDSSAAIEISDTGCGIPRESLPHIFERFYQVDASRSKQVQGVGLGLAIAKWIVEAHHGTIEVDSKAGVGSCFTILLPLRVRGDMERYVGTQC